MDEGNMQANNENMPARIPFRTIVTSQSYAGLL
jgi:hypothetical protein